MTDELADKLRQVSESFDVSLRNLTAATAYVKGEKPRRCESCGKTLLDSEKFFCSKPCEDRANWELWDREHSSPHANYLEKMR